MDAPPAEHSLRWRPRIRLSVRFLMVLVLVLGCWLGSVVHPARVQHGAVAAIVRAGGIVQYDETFLGPSLANAPRKPGWKEWLVEHIGIDYFENVEVVHYSSSQESSDKRTDDALMFEVGKLSRLKTLHLDGIWVTDAGLAHLHGLSRLVSLHLDTKSLSDAQVAQVAGLTTVRHLSFGGGRFHHELWAGSSWDTDECRVVEHHEHPDHQRGPRPPSRPIRSVPAGP